MAAIFTTNTDGVIPGVNPSGVIPGANPNANAPGTNQDANGNVFQFVSGDLASGVSKTARSLLDGSAFDASRAKGQEALARAGQQLRASSSSQFAPNLGQGSAVRSQQQVEQGLFQSVAEQNLEFAVQEEKGRERGAQLAMQLEGIGAQKFGRDLDAVNMLIANGGESNLSQASAQLSEMFPGMDFDFSRQITAENAQDFSTAMSSMAGMLASGFTSEQAIESLRTQGISAAAGLDDVQLKGIYQEMLRSANPMLATLDQIKEAIGAGEVSAEAGDAMMADYMESLTGQEMKRNNKGEWEVVPWDGYIRVQSLSNLQPGEQVKFDAPLTTPSGKSVPPGKYYVIELKSESEDKDPWTGDITTTKKTKAYLVGEDGTKYHVSTDSSDEVENIGGLKDFLTLGSFFG